MDHLSDDILTRLALMQDRHGADPAPGSEGGAIDAAQAHADCCEDCRQRVCELRATWNLLGRWEVSDELTARDVTEAVMSRAEAPVQQTSPLQIQTAQRFRLTPTAFRMAASIVLAVSVGLAGGFFSASRSDEDSARDAAARGSLVLPQFQNASPAMFADRVLGFSQHVENAQRLQREQEESKP